MYSHINKINNFKESNKYRIEQFKKDTTQNPEVIFLGNSITEMYDLNKYYPNKNYLNRGIGGNTTAAILYRLDEVIERNPENIILMIGVNDISRGISLDSLLTNYNAILSEFKTKLPNTNVFTISILPVRNSYNFKRLAIDLSYRISFIRPWNMNEAINNANMEIQKLSDSYNFTFLDLNHYFLKSKYLNPELASDNVHLNDEGYQKLSMLIKDSINTIN